MKRSHRPQRSCLGCGRRDDQAELLRIVALENGELQVDRRAKGRGGYLHDESACWEGFIRKKKVYRAFHAEIARSAREKLILALRDRARK